MECFAKHTVHQPDKLDWLCPRCESDRFAIEELDEQATDECDRLHDRDGLLCDSCKTAFGGAFFSHFIGKKRSEITCPLCKGNGRVRKEKVDGFVDERQRVCQMTLNDLKKEIERLCLPDDYVAVTERQSKLPDRFYGNIRCGTFWVHVPRIGTFDAETPEAVLELFKTALNKPEVVYFNDFEIVE